MTPIQPRRGAAMIGAVLVAVSVSAVAVLVSLFDAAPHPIPFAEHKATRSARTPRISGSESSLWDAKRLIDRRSRKAQDDLIAVPARQPFVADQLVLTYRPGTSPELRRAVRTDIGVRLVERITGDAELVEIAAGSTLTEVEVAASNHEAVALSERNFIYEMADVRPNDPLFPQLWGLQNRGQPMGGTTGATGADIDAVEAWSASTGSGEVAIGIADTGVDYTHSDLASNIWTNPGETGAGRETNGRDDDGNGYVDDWRGWDWVDDDNDPADLQGHGTHVAGTVGAQGGDGTGVAGVNWDVGLVPLRVLGANGSGTTADIASAFAYAGAEDIPVVNASLGGAGFSQTLRDVIERFPRTLFVVAAGNAATNNDSTPAYPCNYPSENLICVASTTNGDALSSFSNYGVTSVDIAAPGSVILSTVPTFKEFSRDTFDLDVDGRWISGGTGSAWARAQDANGYFLADSPDRRYAGPADSSVATANPLQLGGRGCRLLYDMRLDVASTDVVRVEASNDGVSWRELARWSGSTSGMWVSMNDDLTGLEGGAGVFLRYRLVAASGGAGGGVDIDNVRIRCLAGGAGSYGYYSGTSMATPHVAGVAGLLRAAVPGASSSDLRRALLDGVDKLDGLSGKVATGGRLNARNGLTLLGADVSLSPSPTGTQPAVRREPIPSASPTAPQPAPSPSGSDPGPTPSPPGEVESPTPPATPTAPPEPVPSRHERNVSMTFTRSGLARGRVMTPDGLASCNNRVPVALLRNGRKVLSTMTDRGGGYRFEMPKKTGRYLVLAKGITRDGERCLAATSHKDPGITVASASTDQVSTAQGGPGCLRPFPDEIDLLRDVDRARASAGLVSLVRESSASNIAREHADEMARSRMVFHGDPDLLRERLPGWSGITELVGVASSANALMGHLMDSSVHRVDLLSDAYSRIGVGVSRADGRVWVTVLLLDGEARAGSPSGCA